MRPAAAQDRVALHERHAVEWERAQRRGDETGFGSNGRFYEVSERLLGMKPKEYRAGGANAEIRFAVGRCSYGDILVAKSRRGVCSILLGDDPEQLVRDLQDQFPKAELIGGDPAFRSARWSAVMVKPSTTVLVRIQLP
jgi:hypothetical protein